MEQLGEYELSRLYQQLRELRRVMEQEDYHCCLLRDAQGRYLDFRRPAARPVAARTGDGLPFHERSAGRPCTGQREEEQLFQRRSQALAKALRKHQLRLDKKIGLQQADLAQCEAADAYKEAADLLAAYQWSLSKGQDQAELQSFADPQQTMIVALDPALTPQENVQRYYRRYAKAKKARVLIEQQLQVNSEELAYLLSIRQSLEDCDNIEELQANRTGSHRRRLFRAA